MVFSKSVRRIATGVGIAAPLIMGLAVPASAHVATAHNAFHANVAVIHSDTTPAAAPADSTATPAAAPADSTAAPAAAPADSTAAPAAAPADSTATPAAAPADSTATPAAAPGLGDLLLGGGNPTVNSDGALGGPGPMELQTQDAMLAALSDALQGQTGF